METVFNSVRFSAAPPLGSDRCMDRELTARMALRCPLSRAPFTSIPPSPSAPLPQTQSLPGDSASGLPSPALLSDQLEERWPLACSLVLLLGVVRGDAPDPRVCAAVFSRWGLFRLLPFSMPPPKVP
uniref:Uncharacterized protein n=1 Tax=Molossus molossus TaxID=27622 RepID=A0A7J8CRV3_MOLMO|nr:hypothetical protein HJG59_009821 [Molossus molossus]